MGTQWEHWGGKGGEERNSPSNLTCRWLSISALSNRHSPTYDGIRDYLYFLLWGRFIASNLKVETSFSRFFFNDLINNYKAKHSTYITTINIFYKKVFSALIRGRPGGLGPWPPNGNVQRSRRRGGRGGLGPPLFARMKFAHVYFTVLR